MNALTEMIIGLFNLAEAEGRLLKSKVLQTTTNILMLVVATFFMMVATGFFLAAIYQVLSLYLPNVGVLLIVGIVCLLFAGVMIWLVRYTNRKQ